MVAFEEVAHRRFTTGVDAAALSKARGNARFVAQVERRLRREGRLDPSYEVAKSVMLVELMQATRLQWGVVAAGKGPGDMASTVPCAVLNTTANLFIAIADGDPAVLASVLRDFCESCKAILAETMRVDALPEAERPYSTVATVDRGEIVDEGYVDDPG